MHTSKIKNIEYIGSKPTVDIEIDSDNHIFYGNGIATSNSHALSYSILSYWTAYGKTHFPKEFFTAYLTYAHQKPKPKQEIYELVNDAKSFDIYVQPPRIDFLNHHFLLKDDQIYFGLTDIKHVGKTVIDKLIKLAGVKLNEITWTQFLLKFTQELNSRSVEALINSGACDIYGLSRTEMLFEYGLYSALTKKEQTYILANLSHLSRLRDILSVIIQLPSGKNNPCANKNRLEKVKDIYNSIIMPPFTLDDKPHQIAKNENELLGVCLTRSQLDEATNKFMANCCCEEFNEGYTNQSSYISIACIVDGVRENTIKKGLNQGQTMAFLEISDDTGACDNLVVFSDAWAQFQYILEEGNRVLITGRRSKDKDSLVVENVEQL